MLKTRVTRIQVQIAAPVQDPVNKPSVPAIHLQPVGNIPFTEVNSQKKVPSILLHDVDRGLRKGPGSRDTLRSDSSMKQPAYVPYANPAAPTTPGFVDLVKTDRVKTSIASGAIKKFQDIGLIKIADYEDAVTDLAPVVGITYSTPLGLVPPPTEQGLIAAPKTLVDTMGMAPELMVGPAVYGFMTNPGANTYVDNPALPPGVLVLGAYNTSAAPMTFLPPLSVATVAIAAPTASVITLAPLAPVAVPPAAAPGLPPFSVVWMYVAADGRLFLHSIAIGGVFITGPFEFGSGIQL